MQGGNTGYNPNIHQGSEGNVGDKPKSTDFSVKVIPAQDDNTNGNNFHPTLTVKYAKEIGTWDLEESYSTDMVHIFCKGGGRIYSANYVQLFASYDVTLFDLGFTSVVQHYKSCTELVDCNHLKDIVVLPLQLDPPQCPPPQ